MPRLRATPRGGDKRRLSPMTLFDRLREAVFRLIMLSALSKATQQAAGAGPAHSPQRSYSYQREPHHSEAVADCIEFIKKSATVDEESRGSAARGVVVPVPVM
ncbi:hypothetical protein NMG60_11007865 [Bertholletia excelsa]